VSDADATGKHHYCSVGMQDLRATVGTFDHGIDRDGASGVLLGFFEKFICKAGTAADDEGHGCSLVGEYILAVHGDAFFRVEVLIRVAPGNGEWMGGP